MNKKNNLPIGQRFSQVYIERGKPLSDSPRMRERLAAYWVSELARFLGWSEFAALLRQEIGCTIRSNGVGDFLRSGELRDVLDAITVVYTALDARSAVGLRDGWQQFVERVFREENVGYRLDDECGVHFAVDQEFERNRIATIASLNGKRYKAALAALDDAQQKFDQVPPDTKGAVRSLFEAVEIVFKLACPAAQRIGPTEINHYLVPMIQRLYSKDAPATQAATALLNSLGKWVIAGHVYRHGQATPEPAPPPPDLAVLMVSEGSAFLRWLVDLDRSANAPAKP